MTLRHPLRLLLAGLALGGAFDFFFNGKPLGISVPLYALLLLAALFLALRWTGSRALASNLWLPLAALFFAVMAFVRANSFLIFLNLSASLVLLALMAVSLAHRSVAALSLPSLLAAPLQALAFSLHRGGQVSLHVARHDLQALPRPSRQQALPLLRGVLLAAPVLLVFTALLASADLVFAGQIEHLLSLEFLEDLGRWIGHGLLSLSVGFLAAGGLAYAAHRRDWDLGERLASANLPRFSSIIESAVVINAVNLLFFLFVLIQLPYLFGGQVNIDREKYTYAQYARRGFGELVVVALLTLGLTVALRSLTHRSTARQRRVFNLSATLLLGLTCVLLASAFKRLLLYEMAYGFTRLRVYPHVFMVWLGVLLAWFAATLWLQHDRFAIGVLVASLGFVATLDLLNPDALITRANLQRYRSLVAEAPAGVEPGRRIDVQYLTGLSLDAVPALAAGAGQATGPVRAALEDDLRARATALRRDAGTRPWPGFHLARYRASQLLLRRYGEGR